ncbi:FAD/NAD(P)-binding protein [Micromonospora cathayae]|uniref:FAD/NAD(P)-binding protein n=1 Tax=Micromonospora cathayae TaxID=3028804 RepID=A0ABY7ZTN2_9ACTN|nr:FAD/NAD(P)-binding protein [Micromonospora sp. HUAS 3]WDZ85848.1 FAD/NAD(P)-binding protein [Micromonospora sp. HUAS 3]
MTVRLGIVGGGPWCLYALERLAAELPHVRLPEGGVHVTVFDRTGRFGAGAAHDDRQPRTSYLNRVASQLSFAADESNRDARHLLPARLRPTFVEWCQARYKTTGDEQFNLLPQDVPRRYLHGLALTEMFHRYVQLLREIDGVRVDARTAEVTDVERTADGGYLVRATDVDLPDTDRPDATGTDADRPDADRPDGTTGYPADRPDGTGYTVAVDRLLLVTGQSENTPAPGSRAARLAAHAAAHPASTYVPSPYPLGERLTERTVPPACRVGVLGLGLTAVDLILHLTEGRGGGFAVAGAGDATGLLRYVPSGREPARIVAVSPSGLFPWTRPENQKAVDSSGLGHAALEHRPDFLTLDAVATLRGTVGVPAVPTGGEVRQLDFERHLFPLVVLEMANAYYRTLFGPEAAAELPAVVGERYRLFLATGRGRGDDDPVDFLLAPLDGWFDEIAEYVETTAAGRPVPERLRRLDGTTVRDSFRRTVLGADPTARVSPWGHPTDVRAHRFDRRRLFDPAGAADGPGTATWSERVVAHMRRDQAAATQGNLANPVKAACDGVWRDLRPVFSAALDFGGLTASSHRRFLAVYLRHYARMSNGTGPEPMRKILALVEDGLLDVAVGPDPVVEPAPGPGGYTLVGPHTGVRRQVDVVVEGRGHPFDPQWDRNPLYRNMIRRGLVRQWRNPSPDGNDFVPGAIDLTRTFHPVGRDGAVDERIAVLGAPAEGMLFFQLSAARPHADSGVVNSLARWANEFVDALAPTVHDSDPDPTPPAGADA